MCVVLEKWVKPEYYIGEQYPEYYIVIGHNRDSRILDESNYETVHKILKDYPGFIDPSFNHWAVGWVQIIMIHEDDKSGLDKAKELMDRLEDYPVLDEDDYSNRQWDQVSDIADDIQKDIDNCDIDEDIGGYWRGFNKNMTREEIEDKIFDSDMVD